MSPPMAWAAATVFRVAAFSSALLCSAITRIVMSDHLGFVLQFVDQLVHGLDLDAGAAGSRRFDLDGAQGGGGAHAQLFRLEGLQRLLLGRSEEHTSELQSRPHLV